MSLMALIWPRSMATIGKTASGRPGHDPAMMVALVWTPTRSGSALVAADRAALPIEDVAFRVIGANRAPDHITINRFRSRHAEPLSVVRTGARAVPEGRDGPGRGRSPLTRQQAGGERWVCSGEPQLREDPRRRSTGSSPRPTRSTPPRTRGSVLRAAMNFRAELGRSGHRAASGCSAPAGASRPSRPALVAEHEAMLARRAEHHQRTGPQPARAAHPATGPPRTQPPPPTPPKRQHHRPRQAGSCTRRGAHRAGL